MNQGWRPHATYDAPRVGRVALPSSLLPPRVLEPPPPEPPAPPNHQLAAQREERLLSQIQSGFKSITPTLIMTGIAIGFASAIGSALGVILVNRYITKHPSRSSRR